MPLNFDRADYASEPYAAVPIEPEQIDTPATPDPALFVRAFVFGIGGALAGAAIYAAFVGITHINIGYLAILIAYLVAKAMTTGSRGQGGLYYQVAALILTYLSVSAARSALVWWAYHHDRHFDIPLNVQNLLLLARAGILSPYLRFQSEPGGALIGLFILFIGLRAAWRMTSGIPGAVRHPFAR